MILFYIVIFLIFLFFFFSNIQIKINIKNYLFSFPKENKNNSNSIYLKIYVFRFFKIAKLDLKKINSNSKIKNRFNDFQNSLKKDLPNKNFEFLKIIKMINIGIENLDLKILLGTQDASTTAILVGIVSSILSFILKEKINNLNKQKYIVNPIYDNKNIFKIELSGIFTLNFTNIITILKYLISRSVKKNDRTSNRRAYVYSNE